MVYKNAYAEDGDDERIVRGFKFVPVFDVAQTDGEELPTICNRLDGDDPAGHYATLLTVADSIGFRVEDHEFDGSTNGDCDHSEHRIRVETRNTPAQRVRTLAHEMAQRSRHPASASRRRQQPSCVPSSPQPRRRRHEPPPHHALSQLSCILRTMTDDAKPDDARPDEPDEGDEDQDQDCLLSLEIRSALQAFQQQQRLLASFDFSAIPRLQKQVSQAGLNQALQAIQNSVNFTALQDVARAVPQIPRITPPPLVEPNVLARLASSLDLSAITRANKLIMENAGLLDPTRRQAEQFAAIAAKFDYSALTRQLNTALAGINWEELRKAFERLLPSNLRSVRNLVAVANLALDEGLPLAWVPRSEILDELVSAPKPEDRIRILDNRADDVLDDCELALRDIAHEWANQCRSAISAFREGLEAPAQSHAGNIIDSIVLAVLGQNGRDHAKQRAQEDYDELPMHVAVENLVLRPLFLGFIKWFPGGTDPIPDHFARHATAHAVGQPGVFSRHNALVAVMLATSLTVQFSDDPAAP